MGNRSAREEGAGILKVVRCQPALRRADIRTHGQEHLPHIRALQRPKARKILDAGWDFLVNPIMREGGYVRYDGRKSTQILRDCEMLLDQYNGKVTTLHYMAKNRRDLENLLLSFYGVGPVTVNIFLRELRPYWRKSDPIPLPVVTEAAAKLRLEIGACNRKTVEFTRIEAGLIRLKRQLKLARGK